VERALQLGNASRRETATPQQFPVAEIDRPDEIDQTPSGFLPYSGQTVRDARVPFGNADRSADAMRSAPVASQSAPALGLTYGNAAIANAALRNSAATPMAHPEGAAAADTAGAAASGVDTVSATASLRIPPSRLEQAPSAPEISEPPSPDERPPKKAAEPLARSEENQGPKTQPTESETKPKKAGGPDDDTERAADEGKRKHGRDPAKAEAAASVAEARRAAPETPGLPTVAPSAPVHVSGSSPGDVLASLATVPPSQFARGISEAEGASQTALANQAQITRAEIPELKTPTGIPPVGAAGAITAKVAPTAAPAATAGAAVAQVKGGLGKQEVKAPVVLPQRPPEPTRLPGPEQPTGDPQTDAKMAHDAQAELATVAVDDHGIPKDAGKPQPIKLDKEADPAQMDQESRKHAADVERAVLAERAETNRDFGENAIAPQPDDSMIVTKVGIHGRRMGKLKAGAAGPSDAELTAGFDASLGPELNRRVLDKKAEYDTEEQRFEADKQAAHEHTREEIAALERDTAGKQMGRKVEAQKEVAAQREQWRKEIGDHQAKYEKAAEGAVAETRGKVAHEKQEGERKIAGHYAEANRKIAKEHEDAKTKEEEARRKAKKKSSGFFGWVRRKAAALIDWLKDAVNFIYDNVRKAVKAAINLVKDAVLKVIDLVRDAVVGLIKGLAAGLKLLVNIALFAFPETRRRINAKIDAGVQTATKIVNDAADTLKKGVAAALDFLANAIDKLLGLIQSIYSGILTFVSMVVSGEFEEIIRRLGYLVGAAKTVPDVFEQAALEELLGGNLDEPLSPAELAFAAQNNLLPAATAAGSAAGPVGDDLMPEPPYGPHNVAVDDIDHDFALSPEMTAELVSTVQDEEGTVEIGGDEDRSRTIASILSEAKAGGEEGASQAAQETQPAMDDGLTPTQRASIKWQMMKDGIAKWWSDNWGKVLLAAAAAIVGFIALNIVTGGGVTAVLAALMPILTPLFVGVTVVTLASHAKDYVEKGWEGQIRPAGKSLAHGLAAGAIELITWLTFKAGGLALRGAKVVAKGGVKVLQAGARGARRLASAAFRTTKALISRGKIVLQGLGKTKIGRMFTRLSQLGDDLLRRLRFRKFRIVLERRTFRLEGFINPWVLLATGKIVEIETPKGHKRLEVGDQLKIGTDEGVVIGIRGKGSSYVNALKKTKVADRVSTYKQLTKGPEDIAKENARRIIFNAEGTVELRKGIPGPQPKNFQAHHVIPREVARDPTIKAFLRKLKFNVEDGTRNGIMLPPDDLAAAANPKWAKAAAHLGSHTDYSAKVLKELQNIQDAFRLSSQGPKALADAAQQVDDLLSSLKSKLMNSAGKTVNEVL